MDNETKDKINMKEESNKKIKNKTYDIKQYMKEYREKNIERWQEKKVCSECSGKYTVSNSSNHFRSKKHKYALIEKENEKLQKIKNLIKEN